MSWILSMAPARTVRLCRVEPRAGSGKGLSPWILESPEIQWAQKNIWGRWFSRCDSTDQIEWYRQNVGENAVVRVVDVSEEDAHRYLVANFVPEGGVDPRSYSRDPDNEYFLPREVADRARTLNGLRRRTSRW